MADHDARSRTASDRWKLRLQDLYSFFEGETALNEPEHLWQLGVAQAALSYAGGLVTPSEVLSSVVGRLEDVNPIINAFATLDVEGARASAAQSDYRYKRGQPLGPLDGIVMTLKDNITVANLPCVWGTELFRNFIPREDETPVARLRNAGAVILGKTTVSEFSNGRGVVSTPLFGTTRNPWRPELTTGSSSGGAAAAVAAGIGSGALATDGGGSIRIPASHCGLFGLKPSLGQVARVHGLPIIMNGQEVIGPLARSIVDIDLIMRVIAGPHEEDAASWLTTWWPADDLRPATEPRRILFVPKVDGRGATTPVEDACRQVADDLRTLGHSVEIGEMPFEYEDIVASRLTTKAGMAWLLRDKDWRGHTDDYYASVTDAGAQLTAADYVEATTAARRVQAAVGRFFRTYDLILTPVTTALPGPADVPVQGDYTIFTAFANITGVPAVSVPACLSVDGIPIGFQLTGRFGSDRDLLKVVYQYERYRNETAGA
jgi:aspartyl-tRNA(Asn)/glutamyl-tRNA(Gln) amidotransferase subunit A